MYALCQLIALGLMIVCVKTYYSTYIRSGTILTLIEKYGLLFLQNQGQSEPPREDVGEEKPRLEQWSQGAEHMARAFEQSVHQTSHRYSPGYYQEWYAALSRKKTTVKN